MLKANEIDAIIKQFNNTYCKEICCVCGKEFDACLDFIWDVIQNGKIVGYACYNCAKELDEEKVVWI